MDLFHQVVEAKCGKTTQIDCSKESVDQVGLNQQKNCESIRKKSFPELGLCQWVCDAASAMGLRRL